MVLSEIPREEVKLDLGPCYPSSNMMPSDRKMTTKTASGPSPVYESLAKLPKHPYISKIPKHPFVSLTKMDESLEFSFNSYDSLSVIIKNDLYEVEFRRNCDDLLSPSNFSSTVSDYDVPRTFLSEKLTLNREDESIYDIPKPQVIERPKSNVYENIVSSKRWSAENNFECHYSEPSNRRISFNKTRSLVDLTLEEKSTAF